MFSIHSLSSFTYKKCVCSMTNQHGKLISFKDLYSYLMYRGFNSKILSKYLFIILIQKSFLTLMEINKRCISAFSKNKSFVALATKSKLFDSSFSLSSELILVNYMTGEIFPPVNTELKFCKILWCEFGKNTYLATGHESGYISIYKLEEQGLVLVKSKMFAAEDITALDFLESKAVLVAGTSKGKIIFWTLSNLEKEYTLDIPLSLDITAISWNPKVSKILCVGSKDGIIKVLDIKKNSVIMTFTNKEFSEVKKIEWEGVNYTKLLVLSEKEFLIEFDLSTDTVRKIGKHSDPIIGFDGNVIVSKNALENNGVFVAIQNSFDCSISKKDPIIALSCSDNFTRIISIPFVNSIKPFFRIQNLIVSISKKFRIKFTNNSQVESDCFSFYRNLIESKENQVDVLINGARNSVLRESKIKINIESGETMNLIQGNLEHIKNSKRKIDMKYLSCLFSNDISALKDESDFETVFIFSKLTNDYSLLSEMNNSRLCAAMIIKNSIPTFDILSFSDEGCILKSILEREWPVFLDLITKNEKNYLRKMKIIEFFIDLLGKEKIISKSLIDYFWYKIGFGEIEDVKTLNVKDQNIKLYLQRNFSEDVLLSKMPLKDKNMIEFSSVDSRDKVEGIRNYTSVADIAQQSNVKISQPLTNISNASASYIPVVNKTGNTNSSVIKPVFSGFNGSMPTLNNIPKPPSFSNNNLSSSHPIPTTPKSFNNGLSGQSTGSSFNVPTASVMSGFKTPTPTINKPIVPQPGIPFSQQPVSTPQASVNPPSRFNFKLSSTPRPVETVAYSSQNVNNFNAPSPTNQHVPINNNEGSFTNVYPSRGSQSAFPQKSFNQSPVMPHNLSSQSTKFSSGSFNVPNIDAPSRRVADPQVIIAQFDSLIHDLMLKSSSITSLIFKARKNQFVNVLNEYLGSNKSILTDDQMFVMKSVCDRMSGPVENLKHDLDIIISETSDVMFLKAFVELVKMTY